MSSLSSVEKQRKNLFWLSMIMLASGDFFYFSALLFRGFMLDFMLSFSPTYSEGDLSDSGKSIVLFATSLLGVLMHLIGFLLYALSKSELTEQLKIARIGLIVWFVLDSLSSFIFEFNYNVIFNLGFLVLGLFFLRKIHGP